MESITQELLSQWIDQLDQKTQQAGQERKYEWQMEVAVAAQTLRVWRDQGMLGPIPVDLAKFQLDSSPQRSAGASIVAVGTDSQQTVLNVLPTSNQIELPSSQASVKSQETQVPPTMELMVESPLNAIWREELNKASQLLLQRDMIGAIATLEYIVGGSPEPIRHEAQRQLDDAKRLRSLEIARLLAEADAERRNQHWEAASQLYQQVLRLDATHSDANVHLQEVSVKITATEIEQDRARRLQETKTLLSSKNSVPDLERGLIMAAQLRAELREANLSDPNLEALQSDAEATRRALLESIGNIRTMAAAGLHEEAVRALRERIKVGILSWVDDQGNRIDVPPELQKHLQAWQAACRETANDRIAKARADMETGYPQVAKERLERVLADAEPGGHLEVLPPLERTAVLEELDRIKQAIAAVSNARQLIERSIGEEPKTALLSLLQAQNIFPNYPYLREMIADAETKISSILETELRAALRQAESACRVGQFDQARQILMIARRQVVGIVMPSGELKATLEATDSLDQSIAKAEQDDQLLIRLDKEIHQAFVTGNTTYVRALYDQIPIDLRDNWRAKVLERVLAQFRDTEEVIEDAWRAFERGNYEISLELLDKLLSEKFTLTELQKRQAQEVLRRGQIEKYFVAGREAYVSGKYEDAFAQFNVMLQLEPNAESRCKEMLNNISTFRKNDENVSMLLQKAEDYHRKGHWDLAFTALEKAQGIESSLKREVLERLDVLRNERRNQLIQIVLQEQERSEAREGTDVERAFSAATELLKRNLDYEPKDRELAQWAKEVAFRRWIELFEQNKEWAHAVDHWVQLLEFHPLDVEITIGLRNARLEMYKEECARLIKAQKADSAIELLQQALDEPDWGLDREPEFLALFVEVYIGSTHPDFSQAEYYINIIKELVKSKEDLQRVLEKSQRLMSRNDQAMDKIEHNIHHALTEGNITLANTLFSQIPENLRTHDRYGILKAKLEEFVQNEETLKIAQRIVQVCFCKLVGCIESALRTLRTSERLWKSGQNRTAHFSTTAATTTTAAAAPPLPA